ncbi:Dynein regulatory complex subunit 3 (Flagellar-associated protein 134) [Durusdinium trenchii]|uniref:Dynein regulatory complex subunit 3 n=1 Tax=Durusdinium trenchii TaxID=1381693 RepID=A0ABP0HIT5_9DINO
MSLQYTVIDEDVLLRAVEDERELESKSKADANSRSGGKGAGKDARGGPSSRALAASAEEIRLKEVETLRVSYQNILRIDNLVGLQALTTLCLDNNVIEEVENLGHLVNLVWLDLSFNNISKIQGLENLTKLKDLSLYSNNIECIENLEQCESLECLSIGQNKINKLENLLYLRQFKNLRLVTLDGNPVCKDPEYRMFVLAYLEKLQYLDYAMVEQSEVISAREQFQDELLEAQEKDALEEANAKAAAQRKEYLTRLRTAGLEIVESLFHDMFAEDKEFPKLKMLPGVDTIYESYQHEFRTQSEATVNVGLEIFARYVAENEKLEAAVAKVTGANEAQSIKLVETFNSRKAALGLKVQQIVARRHAESRGGASSATGTGSIIEEENEEGQPTEQDLLQELEVLEDERLELREELMTIEIQQVQQLKKIADVYENRAGAIRTERCDHVTLFFRAVEEYENSFSAAVEEKAVELAEKAANNMLDDVSDETIAFLSDRDNLMLCIQGAHDVHLGKLLAQEDALRDGIVKELDQRVQKMRKDYSKQNRDRVFEIGKIHAASKAELQQMVQDVQNDDDPEF